MFQQLTFNLPLYFFFFSLPRKRILSRLCKVTMKLLVILRLIQPRMSRMTHWDPKFFSTKSLFGQTPFCSTIWIIPLQDRFPALNILGFPVRSFPLFVRVHINRNTIYQYVYCPVLSSYAHFMRTHPVLTPLSLTKINSNVTTSDQEQNWQ